jgi:hypothetical protein
MDDEEGKRTGYSSHIYSVGWGLLVMGLSLAAIIAAWTTIGVRGPDFSFELMEQQQKQLRKQYRFPAQPELDPEMLEISPSLRNITTTASDNSTQ